MADEITFQDKDNTLPVSDPRKLIRAVDVNEIKDVVNGNATELESVGSTVSAVLAGASGSYDTFAEVGTKLTSLDNLKAPINNPTFTGTVGGVTKSMVGLSDVDNTSDANKPVSTAQQTALDLKVDKITGKGLSTNDLTDALLMNMNWAIVSSAFIVYTGDGKSFLANNVSINHSLNF